MIARLYGNSRHSVGERVAFPCRVERYSVTNLRRSVVLLRRTAASRNQLSLLAVRSAYGSADGFRTYYESHSRSASNEQRAIPCLRPRNDHDSTTAHDEEGLSRGA